VGKHLEKKKASREREEDTASVAGLPPEEEAGYDSQQSSPHPYPGTSQVVETSELDLDRRGFFQRLRENRRAKRRDSSNGGNSSSEMFQSKAERPAFSSQMRIQGTSGRRGQPRAVAIPYSRLRKERFFDWPPDPTVSRATPIPLFTDMYTDDPPIYENMPAEDSSPVGTVRYRRGYPYNREDSRVHAGTLPETSDFQI